LGHEWQHALRRAGGSPPPRPSPRTSTSGSPSGARWCGRGQRRACRSLVRSVWTSGIANSARRGSGGPLVRCAASPSDSCRSRRRRACRLTPPPAPARGCSPLP
jgi:hypothetical protein